MQIYNIHESIFVMKSIGTRFLRNVFEAVVLKTCSMCLSGLKPSAAPRGFKPDKTLPVFFF